LQPINVIVERIVIAANNATTFFMYFHLLSFFITIYLINTPELALAAGLADHSGNIPTASRLSDAELPA